MTVRPDMQRAVIAADWWQDLQPQNAEGGPAKGDRAALARLRRASGVREAAMEEATVRLCRDVFGNASGLERAALVAGVLAWVRQDVRGAPVARQLGPDKEGHAAMSWLRFRRLLQAATPDERLTAFRRAVALADRKVNVLDLAASLLDWTEPRRQRWIYAYHDAAAPDSSALDSTAPETPAEEPQT